MLDSLASLRSLDSEEAEIEDAVLYPIFLDLSGRRCVIIGGGTVANRKARKLLQARAEVVVISPDVRPELESMALEVQRRPYEEGDLQGAYLAFTATDSREVNSQVAREARERGVFINVADKPSEGSFALPSTLRRGGLQVAVSTAGASPTLARSIRKELENRFGPEWAGLIEELQRRRRSGLAPDEGSQAEVTRCLSQLRG
ncbi:bifunctional precorrin-2 dehydrogenase/sirohydrochlorin ferrochelatase [soil metagenome]